MQDRVANSQDALSRSSTSAAGARRTHGQSEPNCPSKNRHRLGQLLGLVFWSIVGVGLCCWFVITSAAAQTAEQNNILLDFSARWCGPCQQMSPIVSKLERQGYPIRKVDVDIEKELTSRFKVEGIPCFVLIANGREIERISGATDEKTLRAMMLKLPKPNDDETSNGKNGRGNGLVASNTNSAATNSADRKLPAKNTSSSTKNADLKLIPTDSNGTVRGQSPNLDAGGDQFARKALSASTRIKVTSGKDVRYGSGTIIESEPGRAVILTCGHILRGHKKNGLIEVDFYPGGKSKPQTYVGQVIGFDADSDIGLLEIPSSQQLPVIKIGMVGKTLAVKNRVVSVGCGGGESPSIQNHFVTALNRYEGPDTIECSGIPEQGRSGGGLFQDAELVGVCILADPKDKRGIYSGLKPVVQMLTKWNFGHLVPTLTPVEELAETETPKGKGALGETVGFDDDLPHRVGGKFAEFLQETAQESTVPSADSADYAGAEIVCIIRPRKPGTGSRIVVINQATPRFVDDLLRDSLGGDVRAEK